MNEPLTIIPKLALRINAKLVQKGWTVRGMLIRGGCPKVRTAYFEQQISSFRRGNIQELPDDVAEVVRRAFGWKRI